MRVIDIKQAIFEDVISSKSAYGLVWKGQWNRQPAVLKIVTLTDGIHYNRKTEEYFDGTAPLGKSVPSNYTHGHRPFYHSRFRHRQGMTPEDFLKEVSNQKMAEEFSPKIYAYGKLSHKLNGITYAVIAMEPLQMTLKQLIETRENNHKERMSSTEIAMLEKFLKDFHKKFVHGDLQASNVAVNIDRHHKIKRYCLLDFYSMRQIRTPPTPASDDVGDAGAVDSGIRSDLKYLYSRLGLDTRH